MRTEGIATELRPLRLNFAQVCIQCGERWCDDPDCVTKHDLSYWMICDRCDGTMTDNRHLPCDCLFGLIEACRPVAQVNPAPAAKHETASRRRNPYTESVWVVAGR